MVWCCRWPIQTISETMFDDLYIRSSAEPSIVVNTHKGTELANVIEATPSHMDRMKYQRWFERHGQQWQSRKPVTGIYNCAGHVWANRRTSLTEHRQWRTILDEDSYIRTDSPVADDIVLYVDEDNDDIIHVARVAELREGITPESEKIPWVVSKWGPISGEAMHFAHDVPYQQEGYRYSVQYWTDRPRLEEV